MVGHGARRGVALQKACQRAHRRTRATRSCDFDFHCLILAQKYIFIHYFTCTYMSECRCYMRVLCGYRGVSWVSYVSGHGNHVDLTVTIMCQLMCGLTRVYGRCGWRRCRCRRILFFVNCRWQMGNDNDKRVPSKCTTLALVAMAAFQGF